MRSPTTPPVPARARALPSGRVALSPARPGGLGAARDARLAELTRVAWTPCAEVGLEEWSAIGRRFGEISRCSQWWLGDWIRYGNQRFGERYTRAAKLTGYDAQSLMNMVYVASRFEISRRRENLSWSHHATLAALEPGLQEHWLERAVTERLSVADLRLELRSGRRAVAGAAPRKASQSPTAAPAGELVCPTCGSRVPASPLPSERADLSSPLGLDVPSSSSGPDAPSSGRG